MGFQLRQATPEDAEALVLMHTQAHEECYAHLLPPEFFAARRASLPERIEKRRPYLDTTEPRIIALDEEGQIVGLADSGSGRDPDKADELELYSIYTLSSTYGSGLGRSLLEAAIGDDPACLWVFENNPRARAFYEKNGFRPDGVSKVTGPGWGNQPELRMVRD
ncbi:ribosomal protein S18 acetylase RimI-like enzyme [Psychromicrobium silvestre]|uniref:Ribosomal protein S18 acetylase RimI-like enzyme n=1 Tax=Psychromicrobium silvestre TaxID=1645614 RepID=A0A7Y9S5D3_9MICC|nr:GNAT family N-acetyltransferase [Psychromicrobium silvestre]NYE94864.1 ribosomal protein S18 acetylase RimI-like enzyme [Psychromicrobium silvestre]